MMMGCFFMDIVTQTRRGAKPTSLLPKLLNADLEREVKALYPQLRECGGWKQLCERISMSVK